MIWRNMTFTMMEKDQDMAKITLEEEVKNVKKSELGKNMNMGVEQRCVEKLN